MDSNTHKKTNTWYSFQGEYTGNEPLFYEKNELPWLNTLEDNFETIKAELEEFLKIKNNSIAPYFIVQYAFAHFLAIDIDIDKSVGITFFDQF